LNITPLVGSDSDGMADSWELAMFESVAITSNGDKYSDSYSNIEEYLHCLVASCQFGDDMILLMVLR